MYLVFGKEHNVFTKSDTASYQDNGRYEGNIKVVDMTMVVHLTNVVEATMVEDNTKNCKNLLQIFPLSRAS